ncbi:hypothetical protein A167_02705 [Alcanivorax sp. S71-1-4]|uniref:Lnb N-terminal periplasmic domain-containing protein n=1 Tax=Alcanivorax sp. S71-1-4 TaxID=1177159 RepID=UPI00169B906C|nr:DUF4105 domain-containing protein [Alcanivorax sp. S71-1-4]KAF0808197.1 hypothetical protein A167_02705 [Alcanivorax sp. S71-1-4]
MFPCLLMRLLLPAVALFAALLMTPSVQAAPSVAELAEQPRWQALLHVNRGATWRGRGHSYVADDAFFLADNGRQNPVAELSASIAALAPAGSEARCRFPARYHFLADALGWQEEAPLAHCEEYLQWRTEIPMGRAVLVFPAAYLNSPSSMFGHTLLRLDRDDTDSVWMSWAVNFGAMVQPSDNSIFYIYRGLAGGYPGYFSIVPYVTKIQDYAHLENRDMWEYPLTLDADEMNWLVEHLWELKDTRFEYYFFDENCSFRLLELMEVARPGTGLLDDFRFAEVPVNTVRNMHAAGLVASREYRPSKAVELNHLADQLSPGARRLARRLADDPSLAEGEAYQSHTPFERRLMSQTAYEFLRFRHRTEARSPEVARRSMALLRQINAQPVAVATLPAPPTPPEVGHATKMFAVSGGQRDDIGFGELQYRFTYHDWFDNNAGFLRGAQIEGLNIRLRSTDAEALKLERLDVVNIRSLAPRSAFVKPVSWYVHGGIERIEAGGRYRLTRFVEGGPGLSWRIGSVQPYLYSVFRAENNSAWDNLVEGAAGASTGVVWYTRRAELGLGVQGYYLTNDAYRHRTSLTANVPLGRSDALRLDVERLGWRGDGDTEWRLSWRHYFD